MRAVALVALASTLTTAAFAGDNIERGASQIRSFQLKDARGASHSLDDLKGRKLVVVAFLGTECPLASLYATRLAQLHEEYEPRGVGFLAINANAQDSLNDIAVYALKYKLQFPVLKDPTGRVTDHFGATRTPETFVLDEQRNVRYRGRIDDQYGVGSRRNAPTRHDLKEALDELLAGKDVSVPQTESTGCVIGTPRPAKSNATVTYSNQIARLFQKRCIECHRDGQIAPFSLTEYESAAGWAETIGEVVEDNRMPPWHADKRYGEFENDRRLSDEEKELIQQWVRDGAPQGNPAEAPEPQTFMTGWQLSREPDQIIQVGETPFTIPAEGAVQYQYFLVDPGFKEDKWIEAAQVMPGNPAVVHHILVFAQPPGKSTVGEGIDLRGYLVGFVPGLAPKPFPTGMAKRIPANSHLLFQVHYNPIGTEQTDLSKLGLIYADPSKITHEVVTTSALQTMLKIAPNDENHRVDARSPMAPVDVMLLSMMPHMHSRGKSFRYEAVYPSGKKETLLNVPRYDFNWQTSYLLERPKTFPRGTFVHCIARYDNSDENPHNPDPSATVVWGPQAWDEMMIGYFDVAMPIAAAKSSR